MTYTAPTDYIAPSALQLQELKRALGLTGKQMAALSCVGEQHWRKHTGGESPRPLAYANFFHLAAALELTPDEFDRVKARMIKIGATF